MDTAELGLARSQPLSVHLSDEALERIQMNALGGVGRMSRGRGAETGGILLGSAEIDEGRYVVRIEDFEPVACQHAFGPSYILSETDRQEFERAIEKWKPASDRRIYAVGYCRTDTREELAPGAEDLELFATFFADPASVALLIRPRATAPTTGAFFYWENGEVRTDSTGQFSIEPRPRKEPAPERRPAREVPAEKIPELNLTLLDAQHRRRNNRTVLLLALALVALAAAVVWIVRQLPFPKAPLGADPFTLSLAARETSGNLHLTWDRGSPAIRNAYRAVLIIADGDQNRTLELDGTQLHHGSVIYRRMTNHVSFRLEVWFKDSKNTLSETCEFLSPGS